MEIDELNFPPLPPIEDSVEWMYSMRREMQEILPGLYLGPYSAAVKTKGEKLKCIGLTHIVCVRQDIEAQFIRPNFPNVFKYLIIETADSVTANLIKHIPKVKHFIDSCFDHGGKVLVHGNAGISRSAALVIAYIMETYGQTYRNAFSLVQQKRFCINPNDGFSHQLTEYEPIYRARLSVKGASHCEGCTQSMSISTSDRHLKRRLQETEDLDIMELDGHFDRV